MQRTLCLCLLLAIPFVALAVESGQVLYVGGSAANMKDGTLGKFVTASNDEIAFVCSSGKFTIPFSSLESYESSDRVARHLGVVPAIAVGLLRHRQRRHFFEFHYRDESHVAQVAVFEVPKDMPQTLLGILQARVPSACKPETTSPCGVKPNH
jgi:hypothetical protein